jgi:hypothetical protein
MAYGTAQAAGSDVAALRPQVGTILGRNLPTGFLKHADDQTVVTLIALGRAMRAFDLQDADFTDWGVLAAPRFLGRVTMVGALERFAAEGAWGVSPHMIPHRSLHSVSGTISQALGVHGPNFGVGGGPACASEIFLATAAMLADKRLPGAWLVLSGWDPEPEVTGPGTVTPGVCAAAALALQPAQAGFRGLRLRIAPTEEMLATDAALSVESLVQALGDVPPPAIDWQLEGGGRVELEQVGTGATSLAPPLAG